MKRFFAMLLCMTLLLTGVAVAEGEFPELNEAGFFDGGEFVYTDPENGVWRYCSDTLKIEIYRRTQDSPKEIWYEAEVWSTEDNAFAMIPWNEDPDKRMSDLNYPYKIARANQTVLAINSDFAHLRISQNSRQGILLRDGEILSEKTFGHNKGTFPNLDNLALYADGNMEVYYSDEKTAQEYQEMGAVDVLAFGPVLVRDGQLNTEALEKYGTSHAPRTAIGMVEKGHYFAMMLEGRHDGSNGAGISFLAEKMLEKGCQLAFNLGWRPVRHHGVHGRSDLQDRQAPRGQHQRPQGSGNPGHWRFCPGDPAGGLSTPSCKRKYDVQQSPGIRGKRTRWNTHPGISAGICPGNPK